MLVCVCSKRQFRKVSKQDTEAILITIKIENIWIKWKKQGINVIIFVYGYQQRAASNVIFFFLFQFISFLFYFI